MKRLALLAILAASGCMATTLGLGNGSSLYELSIPVHLADDGYFRSQWLQVIGGWSIEVAITPGDVTRESLAFTPPALIEVQVPADPTETPEPNTAVLMALVIVVAMRFWRKNESPAAPEYGPISRRQP